MKTNKWTLRLEYVKLVIIPKIGQYSEIWSIFRNLILIPKFDHYYKISPYEPIVGCIVHRFGSRGSPRVSWRARSQDIICLLDHTLVE